nr:hypothetical protein B0A51_05721 [Rachicladosporium sp. CCFEE 5018]OQO28953.1 hypothetical protein B0A51_05353 [Rachicladosporium sp. CCFEE 5018]OQO31929.1 hypothetical protein B0A51_01124 [Rachicladosporium sp. CCFEE 5018]
MVTVVAGGAASKNGVVFKTAVALESARKVTHAVFDKTGTLTAGELSIAEEILLGANLVARPVVFGLTSNSKHPVSMAISSYLVSKGIKAAEVENVRALPGQGVEGTYGGQLIRCGHTRWLSLQNLPEARRLLDARLTVFGVTVEGVPTALFGLHDRIRPEARRVLAELKKRKIAISIVSGDDAGATDAVAAELAVPITNVRSKCTPGDKQEYMAALATDKRVHTLFCSDGTNDAIALACADVGVHMSSGSDVSQAAADVVLLRPALTGVLVALDLSRAAMHRVSLNFAWSFVYNLFAILFAAGAFVNARIPPQYARLGEIVSVLPVILVALQLKWFRRDY